MLCSARDRKRDNYRRCGNSLRRRKNGLEVLLVSKGDVLLPGREYGFIGGCCGLIAPDIMLFNGDLSSHGDADRIRAFLSSFGVSVEETGHFPLTDIGGILPLAEK